MNSFMQCRHYHSIRRVEGSITFQIDIDLNAFWRTSSAMEESAPRPFDDRANSGLRSSVGLRKGLLVLAHAKTLTTYQHGKLSLELLRLLAYVKKNDDCPLPRPCISVEEDWKGDSDVAGTDKAPP
jgi:hypothetical protein